MAGEIRDVRVIKTRGVADDRGSRREVVGNRGKNSLNYFRQVIAERSFAGAIRAFYINRLASVSIYCVKGMVELVMYDSRRHAGSKGKLQIEMLGDYRPVCVVIPKGVTYGYKTVGLEDAYVMRGYDRKVERTDEVQVDKNNPEIGFDWSVKPR